MNNEEPPFDEFHRHPGPPPFRAHRRHWKRHMAQVPKGFLRHAVLRLIQEKPMSGSDIIQAIDEETSGRWKPSPGSVYPLLSLLQDSGYIKELPRDESGRKQYEITEMGRKLYEEQKDQREKFGMPWLHAPFLANGYFSSLQKESRKQLRQITRDFYKTLHRLRVQFSKHPSSENLDGIIAFFKETQEKLDQLINQFSAKKSSSD